MEAPFCWTASAPPKPVLLPVRVQLVCPWWGSGRGLGVAEHGPFQLSACFVSRVPRCSRAWAEPRWSLAQLTRGFDSSLFRPSLGHSPLPFTSPLGAPFTTPAPCFRRCPRESCGQQGLAWNPPPASAAVTVWWAPPPRTLDLYVLRLQPGPLSAPCPALPCPALPTTGLAHRSLSFIFLVREWIMPGRILPLSHPRFYRE